MSGQTDVDYEKLLPGYKNEYVELLKEHLIEGWSFPSFAGKIKASSTNIYTWYRLVPEFRDTRHKYCSRGYRGGAPWVR